MHRQETPVRKRNRAHRVIGASKLEGSSHILAGRMSHVERDSEAGSVLIAGFSKLGCFSSKRRDIGTFEVL